jgi:hypothetical protein
MIEYGNTSAQEGVNVTVRFYAQLSGTSADIKLLFHFLPNMTKYK